MERTTMGMTVARMMVSMLVERWPPAGPGGSDGLLEKEEAASFMRTLLGRRM